MQYFTEERATATVLERIGPDVPARTRAIVASVVARLHDAVREIEPTHEEWLQAVEFLKDVGQTCTDSRLRERRSMYGRPMPKAFMTSSSPGSSQP